MKQFFHVLKFELITMFQKKSFVISTIIVILAAFIALSIPRFSSLFSGMGSSSKEQQIMEVYDKEGILKNKEIMNTVFEGKNIQFTNSLETMQKNIQDDKTSFGFAVESPTKFTYYVNNSGMNDTNSMKIEQVMQLQYQETQLTQKGYDANEMNAIYHVVIENDAKILGKDGISNYFYTYILIMILYIMIMLYGNQIGVGVASEKSNRAIEILTTSCSSNALIFGKVIAGAIAGVVQTGLMIGSVIVAYQINADAWNHMLDKFFHIPMEVMLTFTIFGVLGYLLYSFLYGAIGALVSKTEEVNSATMPIQILIIVSFFIAFITLQNPDATISLVASYVPITSWMCMFIRVAVGSASILEVGISALLLLFTTLAMGLIGSKLYRRGTLSYGNSMKLKNILKIVKQKE